MIFGPDVSDYQDDVDWVAVRSSGRLFGFTKATEGRTFVASTLAANRSGMEAAGLVLRGLYHFARPDRNSAADEAEHFLDTVIPLESGEVAVLDLESGAIGHRETGAWALAWLEAVERATGRTPWLYSYAPFLAAIDTSALTRFPLWIAGYGRNDGQVPSEDYRPSTDRWARAVVWQYTSTASVPGIDGQCDDNLFEGTAAELAALASGTIPAEPVGGLDHLHPVFAARVANACRARGTSVASGGRSHRRQGELFDCWQAGDPDCAPANPPGTSWHEYEEPGDDPLPGGPDALAVDFAEPYPHGEPGLIFPIAGEPWHGQPSEIPETRRLAGAELRLPAAGPPNPSEEEPMALSHVVVRPGESVTIPVPVEQGGGGWKAVSVSWAAPAPGTTFRGIVGPNWRPLAGDGDHIDTMHVAYLELSAGDSELQVSVPAKAKGGLPVTFMIEAR